MRVSRVALASICGVGVLLLGLAFSLIMGGCGKTPSKSQSKTGDKIGKGANPKNKTVKKNRKPPMHDWPTPAFAIVLSGEQNGYLEPCGCTAENQMGGMSHRADLFRIIKKKKWPVTALDLGGTIYRKQDITRKQDILKLNAILSGFKLMEYGAAALGTTEMKLARDTDVLLTLDNLNPDNKEILPPYVLANVKIQEFGPRRTQIIKVGGKTIGVTAVFGTKNQREILPEGSTAEPIMTDPVTELKSAIEELKKQKPDLMVLLSHASLKESEEYAKAFPDVFDAVLSAGGTEDGNANPKTIGKTLFLTVGIKGKHVGVLGFYPDEKDAKKRLRFELVDLDGDRFKEVKSMHTLMENYQTELKDNYEKIFDDVKSGPHPSGSTFVGAAQCGECHKKAFAKWSTTKHAKAYEGLLLGRIDQRKNWIKRNYDPECIACHVTGWDPEKVLRFDSGFQIKELAKSPELFTHLKGQQCENCHGPGSKHVTLEKAWQIDPDPKLNGRLIELRKELQLTLELAKERRTCYKCHDLDNSPKFNFEKYWKEVEHKGKD